MIVPLSLTFSRDFVLLRNILLDARGHLQISSYDNIPDRLFTGAKESDNTSKANQQRVSIFTLHYSKNKTEIQTTPILRWKTSERSLLFPMLPFVDITNMCSPASFPKVGSPKMREFLQRWEASPKRLSNLLVSSSSYSLVVPKTAGYYIAAYPEEMERTKQLVLYFKDQRDRDLAMTLLNSNAFFWFWRVFGDGFDVTATWIGACPVFVPRDNIFTDIASNLYAALPSCTVFKGYRGKDVPNINFNLRMDLLFRADQWILSHIAPDLGITPEDFLWAKSNSFLKLEVPKSDNYPVDYQ